MRWILIFVIITLFVSIVCGIHSFLDDTDVVQSLFEKAATRRPIKLKPAKIQPGLLCYSDNSTTHGYCMSKRECRTSGGQVQKGNRQCGGFNSCCINTQNTCDQSSKSKVAYFSNPGLNSTTCTHTVNLISTSVCEIRLDFETFVINPPTVAGQPTGFIYCESTFTVSNSLNTVPPLCGTLSGQHIYIFVNGTQTQSIQLAVNQQTITGGILGNWNIRITQLECPTITQNKHRKGHILENKKHQSTAAEDFPYLAPYDCLQYFTQPSGTVMSFNYGHGFTWSNLDYAICFKKQPNYCGITYSNMKGLLTTTTPTTDCSSYVQPIPSTYQFCKESPPPTSGFTVVEQGPLYLKYHTGEDIGSVAPAVSTGFTTDYTLLSSCTSLSTTTTTTPPQN